MANEIEKVNAIAVADIQAIIGKTDGNMEKLMGKEFTGVVDNHVLIEEQVGFTNQSTITFDELEQTTYNALMFQFINIHSDDDNADFRFASTESDDYQNSTFWEAYHDEADSAADHEYRPNDDTSLGSGGSAGSETAIAMIARTLGSGADEVASGYLWIYGLDNTHNLVKQWYSVFSSMSYNEYGYQQQAGGSILHDGTSTAAITGIEFTMDSGNFDGTIKLFGLAEAS
tara:strand:+ start:1391 stop:2077 length:687 start_codon:yes stop_codon:yes gene_type:complete